MSRPWVGAVAGALLLVWGIAGAKGKVKCLLAAAFPRSTHRTALTVGSIAIAAWLLTCGAVSFGQAAQRAAVVEQEQQAERNRVAAAKAERERQELEAANAKAAHEAELLATASQAAADYDRLLASAEALMAADEFSQANAKLVEAASAVEKHKTLTPIPEPIATHSIRAQRVKDEVEAALTVVEAAKRLESNTREAAEMTKGTKEGAIWKEAQDLWETALQDLSTLENADVRFARLVPNGLARNRTGIEKQLKRAERIVSAYELKKAKEAAYLALCGDEPTGCGTGWDGECAGTEFAFIQVAHDPSDVDVENCSAPVLTRDDCWHSTCTVLARNLFGARVRKRHVFRFSTFGVEVISN